ncbi:MAG: tRNA (uridine(34)/cytosine(34)/5-carboxymethylaminomethyluridine(34)-2'-O)-methyltransferase TrmL [Planctomyces sp.]|nr:tRNA (uridine(34)/cytosine(34)/5-carboxymethylaminomethyluridine(34)-2'-O)-methyltransferase TrmL [Planctomyces sp.]
MARPGRQPAGGQRGLSPQPPSVPAPALAAGTAPTAAHGALTWPLLHVVLHQPQIPNNTGNIGRTCVATGCALHLVHPLGFDTSEKACRRAGLDYWPRLAPAEHPDWPALCAHLSAPDRPFPRRAWLFSTRATRSVADPSVRIEPADAVVFGSETRGLPDQLLADLPARVLSLPMLPAERSLNLATAVCAVVYLVIAQWIRAGTLSLDPAGRLPQLPLRPRPAGTLTP